jgi:hypothetical protein
MKKKLSIIGYVDQPKDKVEEVNKNKILEEIVLKRLDKLYKMPYIDPHWLIIAKTHIIEGFMALNRSVMQPSRLDENTLNENIEKYKDLLG